MPTTFRGNTEPVHCPLCGARLELVKDGFVLDPLFPRRDGKLRRRVRLAMFYACMRCEHCHEHGVDPAKTW